MGATRPSEGRTRSHGGNAAIGFRDLLVSHWKVKDSTSLTAAATTLDKISITDYDPRGARRRSRAVDRTAPPGRPVAQKAGLLGAGLLCVTLCTFRKGDLLMRMTIRLAAFVVSALFIQLAPASALTIDGTVTVNVPDCPGCLQSPNQNVDGCYIVIAPASGPSVNAHIRFAVASLDSRDTIGSSCHTLLNSDLLACGHFEGDSVSVDTSGADGAPYSSYELEVNSWSLADESACSPE